MRFDADDPQYRLRRTSVEPVRRGMVGTWLVEADGGLVVGDERLWRTRKVMAARGPGGPVAWFTVVDAWDTEGEALVVHDPERFVTAAWPWANVGVGRVEQVVAGLADALRERWSLAYLHVSLVRGDRRVVEMGLHEYTGRRQPVTVVGQPHHMADLPRRTLVLVPHDMVVAPAVVLGSTEHDLEGRNQVLRRCLDLGMVVVRDPGEACRRPR